jgi:SOS-response transcriptional repressor LexA
MGVGMNIKDIRRENMRILSKSVGGISRLADLLDKPQSQISHLIGSKPVKNIGDKIAAQVEIAFNKPFGWLDHPHDASVVSVDASQRRGDKNSVLCQQVPLITWQEARDWQKLSKIYKLENYKHFIATTVKVSPLAFALQIYGDNMESPFGVSFSEGAIIIVDPEQKPYIDSFVVVVINPGQGATLKQLTYRNQKQRLRPINPRYPMLELRAQSVIIGVVRQLVINFQAVQAVSLSARSSVASMSEK